MKQILSFLVLIFSLNSYSQDLVDLDYVSPFHEGLSAIKKGDAWGFIDKNGVLVIDFRTDVVLREMDGKAYPVFSSGRCLIAEEREGIAYFGYINMQGQTIIAPEYLNATHFKDGNALVIKLYKNVLGRNDLLDKKVIDYDYSEVVIDSNGEILHYIYEEPKHVTLSKDFMDKAPELTAKFLSSSILKVKMNNGKWAIKKI
jgi:hypothetical protein